MLTFFTDTKGKDYAIPKIQQGNISREIPKHT